MKRTTTGVGPSMPPEGGIVPPNPIEDVVLEEVGESSSVLLSQSDEQLPSQDERATSGVARRTRTSLDYSIFVTFPSRIWEELQVMREKRWPNQETKDHEEDAYHYPIFIPEIFLDIGA
uniref:Uncharacterized protein n=1 Tax=Fagus sylvatica TaxID=28930 RepID=A0A2N9IYV7_FAGSY